jgi:hypothetical protein
VPRYGPFVAELAACCHNDCSCAVSATTSDVSAIPIGAPVGRRRIDDYRTVYLEHDHAHGSAFLLDDHHRS